MLRICKDGMKLELVRADQFSMEKELMGWAWLGQKGVENDSECTIVTTKSIKDEKIILIN